MMGTEEMRSMKGRICMDANELKTLIDSSQIVELSWPMSPKIPALFWSSPFRKEWVVTRESGSLFEYSYISMSEHAGTHADAPCHFGYEGDMRPYRGAVHGKGRCDPAGRDGSGIGAY